MKTSLRALAAALAIAAAPMLAAPAFATPSPTPASTTTPIKHVIVVVGENVSFDALYGVYQPAKSQSIRNLLSQKFVNACPPSAPMAQI